MNLEAIRGHLRSAQCSLGAEHSLSSRLKNIERALTPGDSLFRNDAVSAEMDLLVISTELEELPQMTPPHFVFEGETHTGRTQVEVPAGVNEAIEQIAAAIELL
jgi:hypothetical protein